MHTKNCSQYIVHILSAKIALHCILLLLLLIC